MVIVTVGIDLAKNGFALNGLDEPDKPTPVRPNAPRTRFLEIIAGL